MIPYTYLIGWGEHNIWYYGARWSNSCAPSDLWTTYFTSSKRVKQIRELLGEPDVVQVRRTFKTKEEASTWEHKVLHRMNAVSNPCFLNKNNGAPRPIGGSPKGPKNWWWGKKHSVEARTNMSNARLESKRSKNSCEKQANTMRFTQLGGSNNNAKPILVQINNQITRYASISEFGVAQGLNKKMLYTIFGNCVKHDGKFTPRKKPYTSYRFIESIQYEDIN